MQDNRWAVQDNRPAAQDNRPSVQDKREPVPDKGGPAQDTGVFAQGHPTAEQDTRTSRCPCGACFTSAYPVNRMVHSRARRRRCRSRRKRKKKKRPWWEAEAKALPNDEHKATVPLHVFFGEAYERK